MLGVFQRVEARLTRELTEEEKASVRTVVDAAVFAALVKSEGLDDGDDAMRGRARLSEHGVCEVVMSIRTELLKADTTADRQIELIRALAREHITFNVLKKTKVGKTLNKLRKSSDSRVARMAKELILVLKRLVADRSSSS